MPLDNCAVRKDSAFGNDDDTIPDVVERVIHVLRLMSSRNDYVVSDPRILIDDRVLDSRVCADPKPRPARRLVLEN